MTEVGKRPAFEAPSDLARPVRPDPRMRRPAATTVGAVLVLLRVLAGVAVLVAIAVEWRNVLSAEFDDLDPADLGEASDAALAVVIVVGAVVLAVQLALAVFIFVGWNWPRILVMVFATVSISLTFAAWWAGDQRITIDETLATLALDILIMLALSSRPARAYARRPRERPSQGRPR
ncbi:hypothetical protein FLP10_07670 [Agromyces intestinalis]|uniref:Uncharacterized protein n=2 Tax=Agromyces TaxID=33877 RepID=A0A5C1YF70_9MICO|nr:MULTISPECIES: hypothetical protein [Agromyces]QEO14308.1 hypothetical protein FLP10_07670 [Agromyces intestinalis]UOE43588.1 hypothetical protein MTO99_15635 [Agromyces larvae]